MIVDFEMAYFLFFAIVYGGIRWLIVRRTTISWFKESIYLLFYLYTWMVLSVTIFPISIGVDFGFSYNLIPFKSIIGSFRHSYSMVGLRNIGGNILLLMPFGFLLPLVKKKWFSFKKIILAGFAASLSIEILQLILVFTTGSFRSFDVDDLILNTFGAMVGYLILKVVYPLPALLTRKRVDTQE